MIPHHQTNTNYSIFNTTHPNQWNNQASTNGCGIGQTKIVTAQDVRSLIYLKYQSNTGAYKFPAKKDVVAGHLFHHYSLCNGDSESMGSNYTPITESCNKIMSHQLEQDLRKLGDIYIEYTCWGNTRKLYLDCVILDGRHLYLGNLNYGLTVNTYWEYLNIPSKMGRIYYHYGVMTNDYCVALTSDSIEITHYIAGIGDCKEAQEIRVPDQVVCDKLYQQFLTPLETFALEYREICSINDEI